MDFIKPEPDLEGELYLTSHNDNQLTDEDPLSIKFPVANYENEVSFNSLHYYIYNSEVPPFMSINLYHPDLNAHL
jgi:hypothetical protein